MDYRQRRRMMNLSQYELAKASGVHQSRISVVGQFELSFASKSFTISDIFHK